MGDIRYREFYDALDRGEMRQRVRALSDDELVSALAACAKEDDALRANVLATELHNRHQERWRVEAGLRRVEERYRLLVEQAPAALILTAADGMILHVSEASSRLLGWPPQEAMGRPVADLVHPIDQDRIQPIRESLLAVGQESIDRFRSSRRPDVWLEALSRSFDLGTGSVLGIVSIVYEVRDAAARPDATTTPRD